MKLVIDTNVLLSALFWHGSPHRLLELVRAGAASLVTSPALIAELSQTLERPAFSKLLLRSGTEGAALAADLQTIAEPVHPLPLASPVCRDPDDDDVLACAVAAGATLIVSGDRDLLSLGSFQGIAIVDPATAIGRISLPATGCWAWAMRGGRAPAANVAPPPSRPSSVPNRSREAHSGTKRSRSSATKAHWCAGRTSMRSRSPPRASCERGNRPAGVLELHTGVRLHG